MAKCPICEADVEIKTDTEVGEVISCVDCGSELEVLEAGKVKEAPQEEEDWGE